MNEDELQEHAIETTTEEPALGNFHMEEHSVIISKHKNMKIHELALIFPAMLEGEYRELVNDIRENGLRDPICLYEGKILDGRHRYQACTELRKEIKTEEYTGHEPASFVISRNLKRRHLTQSQKAAIALDFKPFFTKEAKARMAEGGERKNALPSKTKASKAVGEALGVSARYVEEAERIRKETPELYEEIRKGETTISSAIKKAHVAQSTGDNEWYTPEAYIEAARKVMGSIDVDPASTEKANKVVKAETFYTKETDGLTKKWPGNVWLNPPYAQPLITQFTEILIKKIKLKEVKQAIILINNATETKWFQGVADICMAICFPAGRIKFVNPEGGSAGSPLQGQAIIYFGNNKTGFIKYFSGLGLTCLILWKK